MSIQEPVYPNPVGDGSATRLSFDEVNPNPALSHNGRPFEKSIATISSEVADKFLSPDRIATLKALPPALVRDSFLDEINRRIHAQNLQVTGYKDPETGEKVPPSINGIKRSPLPRLGFSEIARLVAAMHDIVRLKPRGKTVSDPSDDALVIYAGDPSSEDYGTYSASETRLRERAHEYFPDMSTKEFAEVRAVLFDAAPRRERGTDRDLIAANNCIVDYNGGKPRRIEFSPEYVFLAKLDVDWNPDATNPVIHNDADGTDWDVESWMGGFFPVVDEHGNAVHPENEGMSELLWEIVGATVRPYVSWDKCAFFFGTKGNNGKGTLLSMMRNMLGGASASIPLADFARDFLLEPLLAASAVLVDENDVGTFVEKGANFKAVVTNDVVTINRKHRPPIAHQHWGFMVQCLNDSPTIKDKSESFYRRQLFVKFTKSFTGAERRYIKDDYLKRKDVLEYVLKRVLTMDYYALSEPEAVKRALEEFKETSDPLRAWWNEFRNEFVWDLLPFQFGYDHFRAFMAKNMPHSKPIGRNKFIDSLVELVDGDETSQWYCEDKSAKHRPGSRMVRPETQIFEFDLEDWKNPKASKGDVVRISTISGDRLKAHYRGLLRRSVNEIPSEMADLSDEPTPASPPWASPSAGDGVHPDPFVGDTIVAPLTEEPEA